MRLDKYLADMTPYSRNDIKKLIRKKLVSVNDRIITDAAFQVAESDIVKLDGEEIIYQQFEYYLLYKPAGYITASYDAYQPFVMELISSTRRDLVPVGRLDKDAEGALLITNDGMLNHQLLTASHHVFKKYYVEFEGQLPDDAVERFEQPMVFQDFTSLPGILEIIDDSHAYLTICEGKFHQVKRMFAHEGAEVTYLRRDRFANLTLDGLDVGEYRPLSEEEVTALKEMAEGK